MKICVQLLFLILISCQNESKQCELPSVKNEVIDEIPRYQNILQVVSNNEILNVWLSKNYYPNLTFKDNSKMLSIEFDGKRSYKYPITVSGKTITAYYQTNDKWDKVPNGPKKDDAFMTLTLENSTTLSAEYLFKDWIKSINKKEPDYPTFVHKFNSKKL